MSAMRNKAIIFGFVSLVLWASVTYFLLFYDSPTSNGKKNQLSDRISKLEKELKELIESNKVLLKELEQKKKNNLPLNVDNVQDEKQDAKEETKLDRKQDTKQNSKQNSNNIQDPVVKRIIANKNIKSSSVIQTYNNGSQSQNDLNLVNVNEFVVKENTHNGLPVIAVLVISCNRVTVRRCLDQLIKYRPSEKLFPIIVSQDCQHQQTTDVIKSYGNSIIHIQQPDQSDIDVPPREKKFKGYFKIARHYGWALNEVFFKFGFETAIVVEDDLDIAPDFFEYFLGTHPILKADSTLWCVSAWNDNGKADLIDLNSPHLLYRTDFFPGLGWMLTRKLWQELSPKWPRAYWDDWIRQPEQRKSRACIRPEVSRTRTFGKIGVSNGLFYEKHLQYIKLNEQFVPFTKMNLTFLLKENYDLMFVDEVYKSEIVTYAKLKTNKVDFSGPVRIPYYTRQSYKSTAKMLGLMDDFKSGVPRTGYRGVVTFFYGGRRAYLAPSASWSGYDISWS